MCIETYIYFDNKKICRIFLIYEVYKTIYFFPSFSFFGKESLKYLTILG